MMSETVVKTDLLSMDLAELEAFCRSISEPKFRAGQIFKWMHSGVGFDGMSNLSKALREKLSETAVVPFPEIAEKYVSAMDGTVKYLWELSDGQNIESVFMRYHHGNTICISTQAGCRMGCAFCASTLGGRVRDLTPAEMLGQVITAQRKSPGYVWIQARADEELEDKCRECFDTVFAGFSLLSEYEPEHVSARMRGEEDEL